MLTYTSWGNGEDVLGHETNTFVPEVDRDGQDLALQGGPVSNERIFRGPEFENTKLGRSQLKY